MTSQERAQAEEQQLRRIVRCTGGFTPREPAMGFFRAALVAMPQLERLTFMHLVTGKPLLYPDTTFTVNLSQDMTHASSGGDGEEGEGSGRSSSSSYEHSPIFFHSCTQILDFPRYQTEEATREMLKVAMEGARSSTFFR